MDGPVVGFVFARGGSKGVLRKNLQVVGGVTLLARAIRVAIETPEIERVVVSTDDQEIADAALAEGAEVPFLRPAELATDSAPEFQAWKHAIDAFPLDDGCFVSLPPTAPLRSSADVSRVVERIGKGDVDCVVTVKPAARNPYFNMLTVGLTGLASRVIEIDPPLARRQDAPIVWDMTTVAYAAKPEFIKTADHMFAGTLAAVEVPEQRSVDVDTEIDVAIAEMLLAQRSSHPQERPST